MNRSFHEFIDGFQTTLIEWLVLWYKIWEFNVADISNKCNGILVKAYSPPQQIAGRTL